MRLRAAEACLTLPLALVLLVAPAAADQPTRYQSPLAAYYQSYSAADAWVGVRTAPRESAPPPRSAPVGPAAAPATDRAAVTPPPAPVPVTATAVAPASASIATTTPPSATTPGPTSPYVLDPSAQAGSRMSVDPRDYGFELRARAWASTGWNVWNISGNGVNVLSEQRLKNTRAIVPALDAEFRFKRFVAFAEAGYGPIGNGDYSDDSFNLSFRQDRFVHTTSHVDDSNLLFATADAGYRLLWWNRGGKPEGYLDVLGGYHYWREHLRTFGAQTRFFLPPPIGTVDVPTPNSTEFVTQDWTWHAVRIGARYQIPFPRGFGWRGSIYFVPWASATLDDTHHTRADLAQHPSATADATGGFGTELDGAVTYAVANWFDLEIGYLYWKIVSGKGSDTTFFADGTTVVNHLDEIKMERHGPYVGLRLRF